MPSSIDFRRLRACGLFADAGPEVLSDLAGACAEVEFLPGEAAFSAGDPADHAFLVERGIVQVNRETTSGANETIGLFGPGELVALPAVLSVQLYPASVRAASPAVAIRIPAVAFREALARDTAISGALAVVMIEHVSRLRAKVFIVSAEGPSARIAALFLHLAERFGPPASDPRVTLIPVVLPRATMAGLVSLRPETVSRVIARFRKEGVLSSVDEGFAVDPERLRRIEAAG